MANTAKTKIKRSVGDHVIDTILIIVMIFLGIIMLYPMWYELVVSISEATQLIKQRGILLWPLGFDTTAYRLVFKYPQLLNGYKNTLIILGLGLAVNISMTCLGAYCLSRTQCKWHRFMTLFVLITMYFSGGLIPLYLTVRGVGLYNTIWSVIIPTAISTYNMIILRSAFSTIPESLVESVFIDGGGHWTVLFNIFIPLSLPAMAVQVLYYGVGHWNSWFNAFIYISDVKKQPVQLVLRKLLITGSNIDMGAETANIPNYEMMAKSMKAAMVIVTTVPILVIYPLLQKYFVGGMMIGSLKE
ncbi:MAG: carbohydrate ABC transporter permease [Firmicutes bacterium]|nr:carbohydrate ABC transporter permease [Bacillota bacterium]